MKKKKRENLIIYQSKSGEIKFRGDFDNDTVWGTQKQITEIFGIDRTVDTKYINNILKDKEINEKSNVQKMHIANSDKPVKFYSLDIILAVGYRTNSAKAIIFRKWATKTLKQHLIKGYTINKNRIGINYKRFLKAVSEVKALLPAGNIIDTKEVLELINTFAGTWFSLDAYDTDNFPKSKITKKQIFFTAEELNQALLKLKKELVIKK